MKHHIPATWACAMLAVVFAVSSADAQKIDLGKTISKAIASGKDADSRQSERAIVPRWTIEDVPTDSMKRLKRETRDPVTRVESICQTYAKGKPHKIVTVLWTTSKKDGTETKWLLSNGAFLERMTPIGFKEIPPEPEEVITGIKQFLDSKKLDGETVEKQFRIYSSYSWQKSTHIVFESREIDSSRLQFPSRETVSFCVDGGSSKATVGKRREVIEIGADRIKSNILKRLESEMKAVVRNNRLSETPAVSYMTQTTLYNRLYHAFFRLPDGFEAFVTVDRAAKVRTNAKQALEIKRGLVPSKSSTTEVPDLAGQWIVIIDGKSTRGTFSPQGDGTTGTLKVSTKKYEYSIQGNTFLCKSLRLTGVISGDSISFGSGSNSKKIEWRRD